MVNFFDIIIKTTKKQHTAISGGVCKLEKYELRMNWENV